MIDVTVEVPWYACLSKNRSHYKSGKRNRAAVAAQADIAYTLRQKILPHRWDKEKRIAVSIFVKFRRKGTDAHNFADMIMDALEQGAGIKDSEMDLLGCIGRKVGKDEKPGFTIRLVQN